MPTRGPTKTAVRIAETPVSASRKPARLTAFLTLLLIGASSALFIWALFSWLAGGAAIVFSAIYLVGVAGIGLFAINVRCPTPIGVVAACAGPAFSTTILVLMARLFGLV